MLRMEEILHLGFFVSLWYHCTSCAIHYYVLSITIYEAISMYVHVYVQHVYISMWYIIYIVYTYTSIYIIYTCCNIIISIIRVYVYIYIYMYIYIYIYIHMWKCSRTWLDQSRFARSRGSAASMPALIGSIDVVFYRDYDCMMIILFLWLWSSYVSVWLCCLSWWLYMILWFYDYMCSYDDVDYMNIYESWLYR